MRALQATAAEITAPAERHPRGPRHASFLLRAPSLVVLLGFAAAALVALLGVSGLKEQSDAAAALRSEVVARTLAARLRATALEDRPAVVERAARRSGAELLMVDQRGSVIVDSTVGAPATEELVDLLVEGSGERVTPVGRARYYVATLGPPLEHLSLIAFVRAPERPFATSSLLVSVAALTVILLGVAGLVAYSFARDVHEDVEDVRRRVAEMAGSEANPSGESIPVREADQLGLLTSAFNMLVERFSAAEHAYRQDLAEAMESDRSRSEFLAALSHELRTPLNAILGFCDVLLAEVDGPLSEDARENLTVMRSSGEHLRSLIDDILDLSAMESGELSLDCSAVDVFEIAAEVVREARVTAMDKPLAIELTGSASRAWADPLRVRQILGNLTSNAVKFTARGTVTVDVRVAGHDAVLTVTDTGPGIADDHRAAIFEEYRQVPAHGAPGRGTGLGLAITRRLVEMHGGRIELESRVGEGSSFRVSLPVQPAVDRRKRFISSVPAASSPRPARARA